MPNPQFLPGRQGRQELLILGLTRYSPLLSRSMEYGRVRAFLISVATQVSGSFKTGGWLNVGANARRSTSSVQRRYEMLYYALVFLVLALVAGFLGFGGVAFAAAGIAKILFAVFLVLFLVGLITHLGRRGTAL